MAAVLTKTVEIGIYLGYTYISEFYTRILEVLREQGKGTDEIMAKSVRTWMEIDLDRIARNYQEIAKRLPGGAGVIAVVKANAYGVGALPVALELERAGCDYFAVTFLEEALRLREGGLKADILAMAPIEPEEAELAAENGVTVTLCDRESAVSLSERAQALGVELAAQIKLDTGLSRLGIVVAGREKEAALEAEELLRLPGLRVTGIFTHITASNLTGGDALNRRELERYMAVSGALLAKGYRLRRHCLSTGPLLDYPEYACDYVRLGAMLYGVGGGKNAYGGYPVENSVYLKSRVMQVKELPRGSAVSYGPLFVTLRDTKAAIVPIGFADGLRRALSNQGRMIVHGRWAPIIGKICCDHTILDVTDIPEVRRGDVVTVFGRDGQLEQTPGHYADRIGATTAEITSIFNERIPRIPVRGNAPQI